MFVDVEAFLFDAVVNAQTMQFLDTKEQGETTGSSPEVDDEDAEALSTEESLSSSIEGTIRSR